jgi:hypothetical protein
VKWLVAIDLHAAPDLEQLVAINTSGFTDVGSGRSDFIRSLNWGYRVFTALHVPLYALLLAPLISAGANGQNQALIVALNWFFLIHLGLHIGLRRLPHYTFRSRFSWALISGAGAAGALDLFLIGVRGAP